MRAVRKASLFAGSVGALIVAGTSHAALIGSTVTGMMLINSNPPNYFDPANGFVPATGYENSSTQFNSPTVPVSSTSSEFGYVDAANTNVADFGTTTFLLTDVSNGGSTAIHYEFTDPEFANLIFAKSNDTFPAGGVTYSLVGTTLSIDTPNFLGTSGFFNAQFTISAIPEPTTAGMMLLPVLAFTARRRGR